MLENQFECIETQRPEADHFEENRKRVFFTLKLFVYPQYHNFSSRFPISKSHSSDFMETLSELTKYVKLIYFNLFLKNRCNSYFLKYLNLPL